MQVNGAMSLHTALFPIRLLDRLSGIDDNLMEQDIDQLTESGSFHAVRLSVALPESMAW